MLPLAVRIYENDTIHDTAMKIYNGFEVNQSCTLPYAKAVEVLNIVHQLYWSDFGAGDYGKATVREHGKRVSESAKRKLEYLPDSIGGPVAHKIFRYVIVGEREKIVIWRFQ